MFLEIFNITAVMQYFQSINLRSIFDLALVIFSVWCLISFLGKTRAIQIAKGLIFFYIIKVLGDAFRLTLSGELFEILFQLMFYSLPIIFQREIRIALENFGRIKLFKRADSEQLKDLREIIKAISGFSKDKVGALIILERSTPLDEYTNTATQIQSIISKDLLDCIFRNQSPLHDGAVFIKDNKIVAAKCILPLSDVSDDNYFNFGTRHRAAIGITELSDSIAIVVSEETGHLSVGFNGCITKLNNSKQLEEYLLRLFNLPQRKSVVLFK